MRDVVDGCSYELRAFGVHSLCPEAIFVRRNYQHCSEYSHLVKEILTDLAPQNEKSSVDEFYLNLYGRERLKGNTFT